MSKDNLPEEQTPRTEEAPAENQAEETTLPSPEEESAAAAENEADTSVETVEQEDGEPAQEKKARRRSDTRKLRYGAMATGLSVIVIAAVVLLNVVVGILADRFPLTFDLTKDKTFSLSEQGAAVADSIQKDVQITVFADESVFTTPATGLDEVDTVMRQFHQMAREYGTRTGGKVKVSYNDLTANPTLASQYEDYGNELTNGSILFEAGDRHQMIHYSDLFNLQQSSTSMAGYTVTSLVEQKLASCLNAVASENQTVVTMLTGHGEDTSAISMLQQLYELNGYTVETVDFTTAQEIHADSKALILVGPTKDFSEEERNRLQEWLSNDGNLQRNLLLFCALRTNLPVLYGFVEADYGIQITNNVIQETNDSNVVRDYYYGTIAVSSVLESDLTETSAGKRVLMPNPIQLVTTKDSDITQDNPSNTPLITFGSTAKLLELTDSTGSDAGSDPVDAESYPVTAMAYAQRQGIINNTQSVSSHVLVSGSVDMLYYLSQSRYYNEDLLVGAMNTMSGNTGAVVISGKPLNSETLDFSNATVQIVGLGIFTIGIPAITLIICLVVFLKRRHL